VRGIALGKVVEHSDHLLQKHLKFTRHILKFRDRKDPNESGDNQQKRGDHHAGNQSGVDVFQPKQTHATGFVEHGVLHRLLNGFLIGGGGNQKTGNSQYGDHENPANQKLFMLHRLLLSCSSEVWKYRENAKIPKGVAILRRRYYTVILARCKIYNSYHRHTDIIWQKGQFYGSSLRLLPYFLPCGTAA